MTSIPETQSDVNSSSDTVDMPAVQASQIVPAEDEIRLAEETQPQLNPSIHVKNSIESWSLIEYTWLNGRFKTFAECIRDYVSNHLADTIRCLPASLRRVLKGITCTRPKG